ncbi:flagellar basal body-associated FliL family protein [Pelovirga terrestris]|uniref:Flagellar protein FliL n=1 Tax=Pelovirga terrestris TaxID=2771352 RepID=A0A8J6QPL5_9BACT|nr:flagellar basal body-associated FliL family protein [Pelovirga terrestris]MBD1400436.1 flagellar basal body-associated FliL family protein [Pelovirga terrestris]
MAKEPAKKTEEAGKSRIKMIIIIVASVVLLIGVGIGAYLFFSSDDKSLTPEQEQALLERQAKEIGPMVNIESFIVNILDQGEVRYLKAAITLEADTPETAAEITQRMPQIKDAILLLIGNKTFAELSDLQGRLQLRAELLNRVNSLLLVGKVKRIYFTDFVVQ